MEELTGLDARFLYSETPSAHMHTMKVVVVDVARRPSALTPDAFLEVLRDRLDRMPILRQRVLPVPHHVSHPVWFEGADLDLRQHVRWMRAPAPADRSVLCRIVAERAASPLPRDRPLWELTVVEGLAGHRMAFVVKLHHALADGAAAAAMLENAFLADPEQAIRIPARSQPLPSSRALLADALRRRSRRVVELPRLARRTARGLVAARRQVRASVARPPTMFSGPRTPLNVALSHERTFAVAALPMQDLLEVRSAHGATVNDVFLTLCGGALRRLLAEQGEVPPRSLVAGVPVATRVDEPRLSGNHVDNVVVALRTDIEDPLARLAAVHDGFRTARTARDALGTDLFEQRAGHTPPRLYPLALRTWAATRLADRMRPPLNVIASNVAGPRAELTLDGGSVAELWSVGPILEGIGVNLTAWSYDGTLYLSVLGCPRSLPDPDRLVDAVQEELALLRGRSATSVGARAS